MKIQKDRRFNQADYPEAPEWVEKIFQSLNTKFETIVTALQRNLTFLDNIKSETVTIDLTHGQTVPIRLSALEQNPIMGFFVGSNYFSPPEFTWENSEEDLTVNVKVEWKEPPDDVVRSTLLFVGQ